MKDFFGGSQPRYLLVQYMRDVWRMETRNIGVIVWTPEAVAARFIAEKPDREGNFTGKVDIDRVPAWIDGDSIYAQWVNCWRSLLESSQVRPIRGGDPIPPDSEHFLDSVREFTNSNYLMTDGGALIDIESNAEDCADYLFHAFVVEPTTRVVENHTGSPVKTICSSIRRETGIDNNPRFKVNYAITFDWVQYDSDPLVYSYGFQADDGLRLYETVPLPREQSEARRNVRSTMWLLDEAIKNHVTGQDHVAAIVSIPKLRLEKKEIRSSLLLLEKKYRVFNVEIDKDSLKREWDALAKTLPPNASMQPRFHI